MNKEEDEKQEEQLAKDSILKNHHEHFRQMDDMPDQFRGRGPQESTDIGYDALEDL